MKAAFGAGLRRVPLVGSGIRRWAPASVIFCLAFAVRLAYNLTAARNYVPIFDAALYNNLAHSLLNHHCYCLYPPKPAVSRAPLWPWIMALIYATIGPQDFYARLFYCVLGSGTCLLVYRFARDLFGLRVALITGGMAAIYTGLFLYDGWLYTESLYTFCVTAFAYALYRLQAVLLAMKPPAQAMPGSCLRRLASYRWAIPGGLLIGAASLTRPNGLSLIGLVILWAAILIWAHLAPWRAVLKNALLISVLGVLVVAPWTYRNYTVAHTLIPVETGLGEVLLGAYNDVIVSPNLSYGAWRLPPGARNHDKPGYTPADDQMDTARAFAWMRGHLSVMSALLTWHFINMWNPYTYAHGLPIEEDADSLLARLIFLLIYLESGAIFLLAAFGLFATWRQRKKELLMVYLFIAATIAQNVLLYGMMRFRAPIEPLLVLLAGGAIWRLAAFIRARRPAGTRASSPAAARRQGVLVNRPGGLVAPAARRQGWGRRQRKRGISVRMAAWKAAVQVGTACTAAGGG